MKAGKPYEKIFASLMMIIVLAVSYLPSSAQESVKITFDDGEFIGITSNVVQKTVSKSEVTPVFKNTIIVIDHLDIHDSVNIKGSIKTVDGEVPFHFTGDMYISRKQDQGIAAYVGQIVDETQNFVVKYFEVKNDTSYDLLKYSDDFINKRSISFDLERNGINFYFELDLDVLGVTFNTKNITQLAPENIDFYEIYIDKEASIEPCTIPYDPEIFPIVQPHSTTYYSKIGETMYHKQVVSGWFGSSTYEYYACGKMEGNIVDVGTASTANWTSELKFEGCVKKDGEKTTNQTNYFNIKSGINVDANGQPTSTGDQIEFRIYTGSNTIFTSGKFNGSCKVNGIEKPTNTAQFNLIMSAASAIANYVDPYVGGAVKTANLAAKIFQATTTINYTLDTEFISSNVNKYVVGNKFDSSVSLDKDEHKITFSGYVSTINSDKTTNASTDCVVEWKYNICNGNRILKNETVTATVTYTSNMK